MTKKGLDEIYNLIGENTPKKVSKNNSSKYSTSEIKKILGSGWEGYNKLNNEEDRLNFLLHHMYDLSHHDKKHYGYQDSNRPTYNLLVSANDLIERLEGIKKWKKFNKPSEGELKRLKFFNSKKYSEKKNEITEYENFLANHPKAIEMSDNQIRKYEQALSKRIYAGIKEISKKSPESLKNYQNIKNLLDYISQIENKSDSKLEKSLVVISIGSLLASIFFISNNLTGNVVADISQKTSGIAGVGLFFVGLISFIFAKNKF